MKIINLKNNTLIQELGQQDHIIFVLYKKVFLRMSESSFPTYSIIDNNIIKVNNQLYFCEKTFIDTISKEKIIFVSGVLNISEDKIIKIFTYTKEELKNKRKALGKIKKRISNNKSTIKEIWDYHKIIKEYLIGTAINEGHEW